ncbi:hypothetical protein BJY04DRAFT_217092 [Aspergillus karnatakaensis]|uniref:uncharacterized protein n=1 Tax=Aspergillus karnatakaensis TaxID=1810916 RepID=UPI003CCCE438
MAADRVIQDSDDEDEPLGELLPEQTNRVPVTNHTEHHGKIVLDDSHFGVNFDQFLQSQDAPHTMLTSSQQRREDRWIPATGRVGSMGTIRTEIGLAQERLFDDDRQEQYAREPAPLDEPELVQNTNYEIPAQEETYNDHALPMNPPQLINPHHPSELHVPHPSTDWSQSVSSYNVFDSSSHTPSGLLNRADFLKDSSGTITVPAEFMQNPDLRRCSSMQGAVSSPHDTEPFSSVISPKIFRAKSDNLAANAAPPTPGSVDELSLPVVTDIPRVEKRGRKKKKAVPANDEDDELSPQYLETPPNKLEKRKPGRPPKVAKVMLEETTSHGLVELSEVSAPIIEKSQEILQPVTAGVPDAPVVTIDETPEDKWKEDLAEQNLPPPPISSKDSKKKKLKRSKTTSITLTKTVEPDVEDDVIWIDERPIHKPDGDKKTTNTAELHLDVPTDQPLGPKKRGRKRKKTSERVEQEAPALPAPADEQVDAQELILNEAHTIQNSDTHPESGFSIVLDNKPTTTTTRTQTPDAPNQTQQQISPTKPAPCELPETPQKPTAPETPSNKGSGKHSPISSTSKVPLRVGLSKRARIAPLLKIIKR